MFRVKLKKWGNSVGIIIPKKELERLKVRVGDEVRIDVSKDNPLRELFDAKLKKIDHKVLKEIRSEPESKWW